MSHEARIYFIKSTRSNVLKIGTSADVAARFRSLQTQPFAKLVLLAEIPGDERYEHVLHRHFDEYRIKGEWFRYEGKLKQFVELLPSLPAHVRPPSRRRVKDAEPKRETPLIHHPVMKRHWAEHRDMMWKMVERYGVGRFADLVKAKLWFVHAAFQERGRHSVPAKWELHLHSVISPEDSDRLRAHMILICCLDLDRDGAIDETRLASTRKMLASMPSVLAALDREFIAPRRRLIDEALGGKV